MLDYEVKVRTMGTPNPRAFKFVTNGVFKSEGKVTLENTIGVESLSLFTAIFDLKEVMQVHVFDNAMTITFIEDCEFEKLIPSVEAIITTKLPTHDANFMMDHEKQKQLKKESMSPELIEIDEILGRTIRPGLQADGGDLEVISIDNNILTIAYEGACGTCPSSMFGTLDAIQSILQHEYHPELQVTIY